MLLAQMDRQVRWNALTVEKAVNRLRRFWEIVQYDGM